VSTITHSSNNHFKGIGKNQKTVQTNFDLAYFGFSAAARQNHLYPPKKNSQIYLKCCVINSAHESSLVFWFKSEGNTYVEKQLWDTINTDHCPDNWTIDLNFDRGHLYWYHDNILQKNKISTFWVKLFIIRVEMVPNINKVLSLGRHICSQLFKQYKQKCISR
jgi:hypothetical protein